MGASAGSECGRAYGKDRPGACTVGGGAVPLSPAILPVHVHVVGLEGAAPEARSRRGVRGWRSHVQPQVGGPGEPGDPAPSRSGNRNRDTRYRQGSVPTHVCDGWKAKSPASTARPAVLWFRERVLERNRNIRHWDGGEHSITTPQRAHSPRTLASLSSSCRLAVRIRLHCLRSPGVRYCGIFTQLAPGRPGTMDHQLRFRSRIAPSPVTVRLDTTSVV